MYKQIVHLQFQKTYSNLTMAWMFVSSFTERKILSTIIISDKSEHTKGCYGRDKEGLP